MPLNHDNVQAGISIGTSYASRFQRAVETLIVGHEPNIIDAFGQDGVEIKEGDASVFEPEGGGKYSLVSRVRIGPWTAGT